MIPAALAAIIVVSVGCGESRTAAPERPGLRSLVTVGPVAAVRARVGTQVEARVPVRIADGLHVQANPAAGEFLIPLELTLAEAEGIGLGPVVYPTAHEHRIAGMSNALLTYEGDIEVVSSLAIAPDAVEGTRVLSGSLRYQACNDRRCFVPASVPVELTVVVDR